MTRQITKQATRAFYNNENFKLSNTEVHADCTGTYLYLFNNLIAKKCGQRVSVSLAGYNTQTTRERLNGLLALINKRLSTEKGKVYLISKDDKQEFPIDEFRIVTDLNL